MTSTSVQSRVTLPQWRYAPDAWRWIHRFNERHAAVLFRARSAKVLPDAFHARFTSMGIPAEVTMATLAAIRSPRDWPDAWIETAQRFLGDYRRQSTARQLLEAAKDRQLAAMSYHAAQLFGSPDIRTVRTCRAASAALFQQAMPYLWPDARLVSIPWRNRSLAGYLQRPSGDTAPAGLVVMLNGATTSKEESFAWSAGFLRAGLAVLTMDTPGSGEATAIRVPDHDEEDVLDGVFELFRQDSGIDLAQVSVVGVSLGGALGIRCAAYDRRIMAAVAITPPYDPARWLHRASPFLIDQLDALRDGSESDLWDSVAPWSLHDIARSLQTPLLIFGAGRDLVVPPTEAQLLAAQAGPIGTIVWRPTGGHCLYREVHAWTQEAATWISSIAAARADEIQTTGFADPVHVAAIAREQLITAGPPVSDLFGDDPFDNLHDADALDPYDDGDYARLIENPSTTTAQSEDNDAPPV